VAPAGDGADLGDKLICVYVKDFSDEASVWRVLARIRDCLGRSAVIAGFKPDIFTILGLYKDNEYGIDPVIYREHEHPLGLVKKNARATNVGEAAEEAAAGKAEAVAEQPYSACYLDSSPETSEEENENNMKVQSRASKASETAEEAAAEDDTEAVAEQPYGANYLNDSAGKSENENKKRKT
jgi:hypothetical protein